MQLITGTYSSGTRIDRDVHIGVVGSGDLEVLLTSPSEPGTTTVRVRTSVDGFDITWRRVLDRFFESNDIACDVEINDFGA